MGGINTRLRVWRESSYGFDTKMELLNFGECFPEPHFVL